MKINKKALELIEKGLSSKTVSKLDESQINLLHMRLIGEETMVSKSDTATIQKLKNEKKPFQVYEKEIDEEDDLENNDALGADAMQSATGQETPHMSDDMAPDGMDDDSDNNRKEMGESKKKEDGPNPWAICHSQVGPKKSRKFERCVQSVKKQLKEGKNPVSLFIENQIMKIVEKNLPPRITKGDLVKYLTENSPSVAPSKPKTKPTTKPGTRPQRPAHPGKNPNPGENPAPKAKKETNENSPSVAPSKPKTKPTTKPGTRPQRPAHPGKNPNPGENPAPKAKKPSAEETKDKVIDVILTLLQK
jgi:hypothetical protein